MDALIALAAIAVAVTVGLALSRRQDARGPRSSHPGASGPGRPGSSQAGASASRRATDLRRSARGGPGRQFATALGICTTGAAQDAAAAARWSAGAEGERRTGKILAGLGPGWHTFHDRALPRGRANVDHLVIGPSGAVINVDSKMWSARQNVYLRQGRVFHGTDDRTSALDSALHETGEVRKVLGVPVATVVAVHGARVTGGQITLPGAIVVPATGLLALLRQVDAAAGGAHPGVAQHLAQSAARSLPPYVG